MRVIAGKFRSRKLKFPKTPEIRPAMDRLKETIFDTLGGDMTGLRVLDLYAGMGSLAIEAISRGAEKACMVDQHPLALRCIYDNLESLGIGREAEVLKMDVLKAVPFLYKRKKEGGFYDVIFLDPPYNKGLVKKTLLLIDQFDILSPQGQVVIEHARQEELPPLDRFVVERTNRYGITCLSFLYKRG